MRRPSPASAPACRIVLASSTSNAPRSQNTSIHLARGAQAAEHVARDQTDVVVAPVPVFGGNDVRAEKRGLAVARPAISSDRVRRRRSGHIRSWSRKSLHRFARARSPTARGCPTVRCPRPRESPTPLSRCRRRRTAAPLIRAANSADRSPAKTRWAWLSTNPGITLRFPQSTRCLGGGRLALRPDPRDPIAVDDHRGPVVMTERRPVTLRRVVRHQLADVVVENGHRTHPMACASASPISGNVLCRPSLTTCRPSTITSVTSAADAANTTFSTVAPPPAVRTDRVSTATRSACAPTRSTPAAVQPRARWPAVVAAVQQGCRGDDSALTTGQALVEFDGACLLEQVDHRVAVGTQAERSPPGQQRRRRSDAIAEVTFGGRAEADTGRRPVHVRDVLLGQVGGVHRSRARARELRCRASVRSVCGRAPRGIRRPRPSAPTSARAAVRRGCRPSRRLPPFRTAAQRARNVLRHRRLPAAPIRRRFSAASTRSAHAAAVPSPNRSCGALRQRRAVDAGAQIAGVQQRQAHACVRCRGDQCLAHLVRIRVAPAADVVVQIMEFADRGDSGEQPSRRRRPPPGHGSDPASVVLPLSYISFRHVQKLPRSRCVRDRSAR